jgi:hypothetical protein
VPRIVGGATRALWELVHGKTVLGNGQCSQPRPCGGVGQDHTGGVMGVVFYHPLLSVAYPVSTFDGAIFNGPYLLRTDTDAEPWGTQHVTYNFPVPAGIGYASAVATLIFYVSSEAADVSVTGKIQTDRTGFQPTAGTSFSASIASAGYVVTTPAGIPLSPGGHNELRVRFTVAQQADVAVGLAGIYVGMYE